MGVKPITRDVYRYINEPDEATIRAVGRRDGRRLAAEEGLADRLEFRLGDTLELDMPDASVDVVVAHTVLSHVADPVAALREAARVARPAGLVAVFDGDCASWTRGEWGVGYLLRQYRARCGLTQDELADRTTGQVSVDTISNVERDRVRPHRRTLGQLLAVLDLSDAECDSMWVA